MFSIFWKNRVDARSLFMHEWTKDSRMLYTCCYNHLPWLRKISRFDWFQIKLRLFLILETLRRPGYTLRNVLKRIASRAGTILPRTSIPSREQVTSIQLRTTELNNSISFRNISNHLPSFGGKIEIESSVKFLFDKNVKIYSKIKIDSSC